MWWKEKTDSSKLSSDLSHATAYHTHTRVGGKIGKDSSKSSLLQTPMDVHMGVKHTHSHSAT